jgi:hypothetical protein
MKQKLKTPMHHRCTTDANEYNPTRPKRPRAAASVGGASVPPLLKKEGGATDAHPPPADAATLIRPFQVIPAPMQNRCTGAAKVVAGGEGRLTPCRVAVQSEHVPKNLNSTEPRQHGADSARACDGACANGGSTNGRRVQSWKVHLRIGTAA